MRQLNTASVLLRLLLATVRGGMPDIISAPE